MYILIVVQIRPRLVKSVGLLPGERRPPSCAVRAYHTLLLGTYSASTRSLSNLPGVWVVGALTSVRSRSIRPCTHDVDKCTSHETRPDAPCFCSQPLNFIHQTSQLTSDHVPMTRRHALHAYLPRIRPCPHEWGPYINSDQTMSP